MRYTLSSQQTRTTGNTMTRSILTLCLLCTYLFPLSAQEASPKREFRAVWVATVKNIDYPRQPSADPDELRAEYRRLLRGFRELGLNAVIFQVRPAADAFYRSALVPWSEYLTGYQGIGPKEGFDPLQFLIEETHRHGMEFHAWLNPYRATTNLDTLTLSPRHAFYQHRDWMIRYGNKFYFNPALPEVRRHLNEVVAELVQNYELDAIHFDDYFYPYKELGEVFPDSLDFRRYGAGLRDIEDWRRSNTDALIQSLSETIRKLKPHVRFGVSPFGVWRNMERDPSGSPTRAGASSYDDLYADVLKWLREGWIDYVAPQLYWHIGFELADHERLLDWWSRNSFGKQLYIGHAFYKINNDRYEAWRLPEELPRQILLNRRNLSSSGSIFFRSEFLLRNPLGVTDSLRQLYEQPALVPESPSTAPAPAQPQLKRPRSRPDGILLHWRPSREERRSEQLPAYYVIYRFPAEKGGSFQDPRYILTVTPHLLHCDRNYYIDYSAEPGTPYIYAISAVNRYHREGPPKTTIMVRKR